MTSRLAIAVVHKLHSQRGASLPFALLLLLICVLLCSAIMAATSGVSGRTAKLAEMDQHYYSATSAMNLLAREFDGQEVVLKCEKTTQTGSSTPSYKVTLVIGQDDAEAASSTGEGAGSSGEGNDKVVSGGTSIGNLGLTLPQLTALYLFSGSAVSQVNAETVWESVGRYYENGSTAASGESQGGSSAASTVEADYSLAHAINAPDGISAADLQGALAVSARQLIYPDGSFMLTATSGTESTVGDESTLSATGYRLRMVCEPDIIVDLADSGQLDKTQKTDIRLVTVAWEITELEKAGDA